MRYRLAVFVVMLLACIAAAVNLGRLLRADRRAHSAAQQLQTLETGLTRLKALRAKESLSGLGPRPEADLIDRITQVLAQSALPPEILKNLQQHSDGAVPGGRMREQRVTALIEPVTPAQLGLFLARWQDAQPAWRVSQLDLTHAGPEDDADSMFRAQLSLRAAYVATEAGEPR